MKFRLPNVDPAPVSPGGGVGRSRGTPPWLKEWLANQGKWFEMECGCKDAWDERSLTILHKFGPKMTEIFCERCRKFTLWKKWVGFNEYMNIPPAVTPDEPLF